MGPLLLHHASLIYLSLISQPNQVESSQNFQGIFLWEFQDDLNKKQTGQQTNKQIDIFLNPIYLIQIKSNLHEIFRVYSCWCSKIIKIKNKQFNKQTNKQTNI